MPHTVDNVGAAAATVTSETMYVEGEPSVQTGLEARVVTVPKRGGGQGTPVSVARKEPRKSTKGSEVDRERIEEEEGTHGMTQRNQPNHRCVTRQGFLIAQQKENIDTDQVPLLSVRLDIIRKRLTCSSRGCHLPDW